MISHVVIDEVARQLYKLNVVADMWNTEQESLKENYRDQVRRFVTATEAAGYTMTEENKIAASQDDDGETDTGNLLEVIPDIAKEDEGNQETPRKGKK